MKTLLVVLGLTLDAVGFAAGKASIAVSGVKEGSATKLVFKTIPGDGLVINAEGPWKLELKKASGVSPTSIEQKRSDWKEATASFEVPVTPTAGTKKTDVEFKVTTFVCTKDKSQCFREVVTDKATVILP